MHPSKFGGCGMPLFKATPFWVPVPVLSAHPVDPHDLENENITVQELSEGEMQKNLETVTDEPPREQSPKLSVNDEKKFKCSKCDYCFAQKANSLRLHYAKLC